MRVAIALCVLVSVAQGQPSASPPPPPEPQPTTRTESYRTTVAIVDALAIGTLVGGLALVENTDGGLHTLGIITTVVGGAAYAWAVPIVHDVVDSREKAQIDIVLRVSLPAIGAAAGVGIAHCAKDDRSCKVTGLFAGGAVGIAAASALDLALLAKRRVAVPYAGPTLGGAVVGIAGRF